MAEQRSALAPTFSFDSHARRYRDLASGRYVPAGQVRAALDAVVDGSAGRMRAIAGRLQSGELSLKQWQIETIRVMKAAHVAAATAASGGFGQMSPASYGAVGQMLRQQYAYLSAFAQDIASGRQPMDGRLLARADLYGHAARATHRETERRNARLSGRPTEARRLGPADHCPDCLSEAARGWQPIGTLRRIGDTPCTTNCHCWFEFGDQAEAAAA